MKKTVALLLCFAIILSAVSLLFTATFIISNPFSASDKLREESIHSSLGANSFGGMGSNVTRDKGCIVKFKNDADLETIYNCVKGYEYKLLANSSERMFWIADSALSFKNRYAHIVENAEEEQKLALYSLVDDPLASSQWELNYLQAYRAWDITMGVRGVTVAVLDSGIYREHPDFENVNILAGYDAVNRSEGVTEDVNGHGTKISSIIAAASDNGIGMAGMASNISILPIRISDSTGYIHSSDFIEAVYYAADAGVDVINMSFGGYSYSAMEEVAIQYADSKGCVLVSAAGNGETNSQYAGLKAYPASYNGVISVGAIDENGVLCPFSQRNDAVDLVAPGDNITVANTTDGYEKERGTSFASAYVSAVAALCLSAIDKDIRFSSEQFLSLIAKINGGNYNEGYGYGDINAYSAVSKINTPLVAGVTDGGVYHKNVSITFNRGTATLDGENFESGGSVITSGSHTLIVTDKGNRIIIDFITDNIPLKYDYKLGSSSASITFTRGTATLDGLPYLSGSAITSDGKHYFKLTGPYGNTESFEFECSFKAPEIFGVENGGFYTTPVYITAGEGGILTLNGAVIPNEKVVSENGSYALISSTVDGKNKTTVYFTVSIPNTAVYNSAVVSPGVIADEKYRSIILYNEVLSGVRVFAWNDLSRTKSFVRTQAPVTGYGFHGEKLVLLHSGGISVCDRSAVAAGFVSGINYFPFERTASDSVAVDGFVYYATTMGADYQIWRIDVASGKNALLCSVAGKADMLCADKDKIVAASYNGTLSVLTMSGEQSQRINVGEAINSIAINGEYICTDKCVYGTASAEKLFSLCENEKVLFAKNGVLVTSLSVYDLRGRRRLAAFSEKLSDAVVCDNGYAFKALDGMRIETVKNEGITLGASNAAKLLNAAEISFLQFSKEHSLSAYESFVLTPDSFDASSAVIPEGSDSIYVISPSAHMLYTVSCDTLSVTARTNLRFKPSAICSDGQNIYVAFEDESCIFVCSANGGVGEYMRCADRYTKMVFHQGKLYALNKKGDIYAIPTNAFLQPEVVIKSQKVIDFACDGAYVYAYLKPVTTPMVYKINTHGYSIESAVQVTDGGDKIFASNGMVFLHKKAYSFRNLELAYTLDGTIKAVYKNYVLSTNGLHLAAGGALVGDCRVSASLPLFDDGFNYYSFEKGRLCKITNVRADLHSLPTVSGIKPSETIHGPAGAVFAYGFGYLDGKPYTSGTEIENGGMHSFVLALPFGVSKTVNFVIQAEISSISLYAEKFVIGVNETAKLQVTARPYTYGMVDVSYSTDNDNVIVLEDGSIIGASVGTCVITATTSDGTHSASITISVTKGALKFDSSYFYADNYMHIVRGIAPGTDVEAFFAAAAETHGTISIRGYNDVAVTAGMIHTGMKAELYDIYGAVIDSWPLSVTGDIDCDGYITANDYYVLEALVKKPDDMSTAVSAAADIDRNRVVNAFDLLVLKEHLLGNPFIATTDAVPTRPVNTSLHLMMPEKLASGSSFTVGLTLTEMKNITAVSGVLKYDTSIIKLSKVEINGTDGDGFYSVNNGGVNFFADSFADVSSAVVLTAEFTVADTAKADTAILFECNNVLIYDGAAAALADTKRDATVSDNPETAVMIYNLPSYDFDNEVTEYRCSFPAHTQKIHVSAYPNDSCDIVGNTEFYAEGEAQFAVVVKTENGTVQYNYVCEREVGEQHKPNNENIFKSNNSNLSVITVENAELYPSFNKAVTLYYVINVNPHDLKVSATPENELATVTVNPYDEQDGTVTVVCTAEDGSTTTYTLLVCKQLPIRYNAVNNSYAWLWLFSLPALLGGALAVLVIVKKTGKKKQLPQSTQ